MSTPPSHIIVVDEAGNPPLHLSGVPNGYVTCAVAIPVQLRAAVIAMLPRDEDTGAPLKTVSLKTTDAVLATFLKAFFALDVGAGLVCVDSSDRGNVDLLQEAVDYANENRHAQGKKQLNPTSTAYWLLAPRAVIHAWAAVSLRQKSHLRHFDLVLDDANLHSRHRKVFVQGIIGPFREQGVEVEGVRWTTEQDEPLLHVPDYVAGVALRNFTRHDCPASGAHLVAATKRGQINTQDPVAIYTLPPKK